MMPYGSAWEEELDSLFQALPPRIAAAAKREMETHEDLLEVVLDLGRPAEARFIETEVQLDQIPVSHADLEFVEQHIGLFGDDNRAGIERTLHRISAIRNRAGDVVGLTCRVGRAVTGTIDILKDIVVMGKSILILGPPGIGKTTMLRECARVLADECDKRVIIVDTSNEIAGDGDIPHPGIGRARRMQVRTPLSQHSVMIEAVENHMPQVIVIDEIGTAQEAEAARTIAERGVQLVATAHGTNLDNLLVNPTLNDLLGGIQTVTLGDEEARRRGSQKSVLERKAPPTFDVLVEIQDRDRVLVHMPLDETVDDALRGRVKPPQLRTRGPDGAIISRIDETFATHGVFEPAPYLQERRNGRRDRRGRDRGIDFEQFTFAHEFEDQPRRQSEAPANAKSVFPYGVSRNYLEQSIKELRLPLKIQHNIDDADMVVTLKNYYRRKDSPARIAEERGIPIHVLRSNTISQIKKELGKAFGVNGHSSEEDALQEALEGIQHVKEGGQDVELSPQNSFIRRLQHQLVVDNRLVAQSFGSEPNRHLVILAPESDS